MTDFIKARLDKFADDIQSLPHKNGIDLVDPLFLDAAYALQMGTTLYNNFMGAIIGIHRVHGLGLTPEHIEKIIELDSKFQTYLEENVIIPAEKRTANRNKKNDEDLVSFLLSSFQKVRPKHHDNIAFNECMKIIQKLRHFNEYSPIFDALLEQDTDNFVEKLPPEERLGIEQKPLTQDILDALNALQLDLPTITMPKSQGPKRP
jgi:hypothetical protein